MQPRPRARTASRRSRPESRRAKRSRPNRSAWRRMAAASNGASSAPANAGGEARPATRRATSTPVTPSTTVSSAPPRPSATTGRPHACASSGHDAEILFARAAARRRAWRYSVANLLVGQRARGTSTPGPAMPPQAREFRAVPDDAQRHAGLRGRPRWPGRSACTARAPTRPAPYAPGRRAVRAEEPGVDRRIHDRRLAIIVSRDPRAQRSVRSRR